MPDPVRSPKQSRLTTKNRSHPYARPLNLHRARDAGVSRSGSIVNSIKNFVTAPLAWLSSGGSQESNDHPQKRRELGSDRGGSPPRAKRVRRDSPDTAGHLDPPNSLFLASRPQNSRRYQGNGVEPARTISSDTLLRLSDLALLPSRHNSVLSRTSMSVDPPSQPALRRSTTRDLSMPPPSPFSRSYARSSLTPQPSGATFGPSPKRKPRESTAPPLLSSPVPKPTFTRPPSSSSGQQGIFPRSQSRDVSEGPASVLHDRSKKSVSPVRQEPSRSLLIPPEIPVTHSPTNTIAKTLSTLENYRTPLHAARFPSATSVDSRRPRKVHVPVPSKLHFDHTPDGWKEKVKRGPAVIGPYSSEMSGMRKLLARRREELEKEVDMEKNMTSEESRETGAEEDEESLGKKNGTKDDETAEEGPRNAQINDTAVKADSQPSISRSSPRPKSDGSLSLRAPSSKVGRMHASAPKLAHPRNKFSLQDDEVELNMSVDEVKKYQAAQIQVPISFPSSTRSMSETGMQTDADVTPLRAKTPPLPSQPQTFDSLLSRIGTPDTTSEKPPAPFPTFSAQQPERGTQAQKEPSTISKTENSSTPTTLPFRLGEPVSVPKHIVENVTSSPISSPPVAPTASAGVVPSFFTNTQVQFTPPKLPSGSLFGDAQSNAGKTDVSRQTKNASGGTDGISNVRANETPGVQKEINSSPFGVVNKPSVVGESSRSIFGGEQAKTVGVASNVPADVPSSFPGFGTASTASDGASKPAFSFTDPHGSTDSGPSISILGAANKENTSVPDADKSKNVLSPPPALIPEANHDAAPTSKPDVSTPSATTVEASRSSFPFAVPTSSMASNIVRETANSPFSFGAAPSTPPPAEKKSSFTFGSTSGFPLGASTSTPNGEAPKSGFLGFGTTSTNATQKPTESSQVESSDGMEINGADRMEESPTRTVEKKDATTQQQLGQISQFAGFGSGTVSSGFPFGQSKPASSTGVFSFGEPKPPSGTGFNFSSPSSKSSTAPSASNIFTFGQSVDKPASASLSAGFAFGADSSKNPAQPQMSFGSQFGGGSTLNPSSNSKGFPFGQSPSTVAGSNPFGQPSQQSENGASTANISPSPFPPQASQSPQSQSPSFSFNVPTPNATNAFSATPVVGAGPSTGSPAQPFQFGAPNNTQQQPTATSGNAMFTLGGAATPPRKVKGLPSRRARRP